MEIVRLAPPWFFRIVDIYPYVAVQDCFMHFCFLHFFAALGDLPVCSKIPDVRALLLLRRAFLSYSFNATVFIAFASRHRYGQIRSLLLLRRQSIVSRFPPLTSDLYFASSGTLSQPMLGFTTTFCPGLTNCSSHPVRLWRGGTWLFRLSTHDCYQIRVSSVCILIV